MLPREHGAWAVLAAPILVGFAAAGGGSWGIVLAFVCAALGGFCLRTPLQALLSPAPPAGAGAWLAVYALLAAAGAGVLFLRYERWSLLAFALPAGAALAFNLRQNLSRKALSLPNEIVGIAALCLGAPAAHYAGGGELSLTSAVVWTISFLYFVGPVFHVKMAALQHRAASDPACGPALEGMRRRGLAYHGASLGAVGAGALAGLVPWFAVLPFLAALEKNRRRGTARPGKVNFKSLGYQEAGYSVVFVLAVAAGYR